MASLITEPFLGDSFKTSASATAFRACSSSFFSWVPVPDNVSFRRKKYLGNGSKTRPLLPLVILSYLSLSCFNVPMVSLVFRGELENAAYTIVCGRFAGSKEGLVYEG